MCIYGITGNSPESKQSVPWISRGISGSTVKFIAMVSMLVDHLAASGVVRMLYDSDGLYRLCRAVGRMAFPLFCFLLVEGHIHTKNQKRYLGRLFLFALLSEIPFDLAFYRRLCYLAGQNVYFTLFLGMLTLCGVERIRKSDNRQWIWVPMAAGMVTASLLHTDYGGFGVALILIFYWFREVPWKRNLVSGCACIGSPAAWAALIPMQLYNGDRGVSWKYLFYLFYPLHLLLLCLIREMI
ncbi:MAG: conjugal transfer protein TraX [Lachnospiraceae bacterium]|nr:conjugal transfer protein TraX [Lachnospiraceae bacterium]